MEDKLIYIAVVELHLTIARIVHVDRRDGWSDHLNELEVVDSIALRGHQLYMMDVCTEADNQTILMLLDSLNKHVRVSFVPQHFQTLEPVVTGEYVRLSDKILVRIIS